MPRPLIVGTDAGPSPPYPLRMEGEVISGFGRGSKELGIPTANLPVDAAVTPWIADATSGIYFGWAALALPATHPDQQQHDGRPSAAAAAAAASPVTLFPMVMSIGYNPFYKNTVRSAEVHVLHRFGADFYGARLRLLVCGFVREERDYGDVKALVEDIKVDCEVARRSLDRPGWAPRELGRGTLDCSWLLRELEPAGVSTGC